MKKRMLQHLSLSKSYPIDDGNVVNKAKIDSFFGLIRFRGLGWYQDRGCANGARFQLRFRGEPDTWQLEEWLKVEKRIDEFVKLSLDNIPIPFEAPEALDCDSLIFSSINFYSTGKFSLGFSGDYCDQYHEYVDASFENYALKNIEWIT